MLLKSALLVLGERATCVKLDYVHALVNSWNDRDWWI